MIGGAVDSAFFVENFPARYALKANGGILKVDAITTGYWRWHRPHRGVWTRELDQRPSTEKWWPTRPRRWSFFLTSAAPRRALPAATCPNCPLPVSAALAMRPMLLGSVCKATGNTNPVVFWP